MRLTEIRRRIDDQAVTLTGAYTSPSGDGEIIFSFPADHADAVLENADAFVGPLLVPAVLRGEELVFDVPVSPLLLDGTRRVLNLLCQWWPHAHRINIDLPTESRSPFATGVGCFVSGGIDSTYAILSEQGRVTHLVHMHGTSERRGDPAFAQAFAGNEARARRAASRFGLPLVMGETNVRDCFPLNWGAEYHGSALAGVTLSLAGIHSTFLIPSTYAFSGLCEWGSHPLIDEAYTTEAVRIIHYGCGATRAEKTEWIAAHHPEALIDIQVCVNPTTSGERNCGRCWKCVRTMTALALCDSLGGSAFPERLPENIEALLAADSLAFVTENLNLGRRVAPSSPLTQMLERVVIRKRRKDAIRALAENLPVVSGAVEARRQRIKQARSHHATLA